MVRKKFFSMLAGATFSSVINALLIIVDSIICGLLVEYEKNLEPKLQGDDFAHSCEKKLRHSSSVNIYNQIPNGLALLVCPALEFQPVAVGHKSAAPLTILYHLAVAGPHTDCGFLTFAGSLPEADVVQELVYMVVNPLFSLPCAPDLYALLQEPLHHEWGFIIPPSKTVDRYPKVAVILLSTQSAHIQFSAFVFSTSGRPARASRIAMTKPMPPALSAASQFTSPSTTAPVPM